MRIPISIHRQPDEITCGPTCLQAIYQHFNDLRPLQDIISEIPMLDQGGTLSATLASHALRNGYRATIYSYNLTLFDPSWFELQREDIAARLQEQLRFKDDTKMHFASQAYLDFLQLGGYLKSTDLTRALISGYLLRGIPVLAGISSTYLYRTTRVYAPEDRHDDVRGEPCGHFVVLCGYDRERNAVLVADPYLPNLTTDSQLYEVNMEHLICAILLGVLTYDGNLLIIEKPE